MGAAAALQSRPAQLVRAFKPDVEAGPLCADGKRRDDGSGSRTCQADAGVLPEVEVGALWTTAQFQNGDGGSCRCQADAAVHVCDEADEI